MYIFIKRFIVTVIILMITLLSNFAIAQNKPTPPKPVPQVKQSAGLNAEFITALIADGEGGTLIRSTKTIFTVKSKSPNHLVT
jgi:hypothetical protein